jgi:hypothetical protein
MTAAQSFTTFNYRGVQILHPVQNGVQMTQRGAAHNRTGCSLEQNGVQRLHPIRQLTIKEPNSSRSAGIPM